MFVKSEPHDHRVKSRIFTVPPVSQVYYLLHFTHLPGILKQLVELWTDEEKGLAGFGEFSRKHIVPACVLTPTKDTFDWSDGQTVLVSLLMNTLRALNQHGLSIIEEMLLRFVWFVNE